MWLRNGSFVICCYFIENEMKKNEKKEKDMRCVRSYTLGIVRVRLRQSGILWDDMNVFSACQSLIVLKRGSSLPRGKLTMF